MNQHVGATNVTAFDHSPIKPIYSGDFAQHTMLDHWHKLMYEHPLGMWDWEDYDEPLDTVLRCDADQRAANVAATFIVWLGSNNGRSFLDKGRKLMDTFPEDGYLFAWALENKRYAGSRMIELLLTPREHIVESGSRRGFKKPPRISDHDNEVVESITTWLATQKGQQFLAACEADIQKQIKARDQAIRDQFMAQIAERKALAANKM